MLRQHLIVFILMPTCVIQSMAAAEPAPVIHQLRIYEIFDENEQAFHARFRDHAMRIMAKYDFKILATWETQHNGRPEFAWPAIQDRVLEVQDYSPTHTFAIPVSL